MQAVATRGGLAAAESPVTDGGGVAAPDIALCDLIRARSVLLGDRAYLEHARDDGMRCPSVSWRRAWTGGGPCSAGSGPVA